MMRQFALFLILAFSAGASATTFTANLKDIVGNNFSTASLVLSLQNCGTYPPQAGAVIVPKPIVLYPDNLGQIGVTKVVNVKDQADYQCGTSTGVAFYRIAVYYKGTAGASIKAAEADYDITGPSFDMNSATPRVGSTVVGPISFPQMPFVLNLEVPSTNDSGRFQHSGWPRAVRVIAVTCNAENGTVFINLQPRSSTDWSTNTADILSAPIECGLIPSGVVLSSPFLLSANSPLALMIPATTGTPTMVRVRVYFQIQ